MNRTGKVPYLWMPEFIAHEVQVGMATNRKCNQSDHLPQDQQKINNYYK